MKKKLFLGIFAVIMIVLGLIYFCSLFLTETGSKYYYTRIDNSKMEKVESRNGVIDFQGGMPCSYTLSAYNEEGNEKEITFGASKELKEGAFIRLSVVPVRGVIEWSEVQYEELPETVQSQYNTATHI